MHKGKCRAAVATDGRKLHLSPAGLQKRAPAHPRPALLQATVAKLFKLLHARQAELGLAIKDVKSHVLLQPLTPQEAEQAWSEMLGEALRAAGWWRLEAGRYLDTDLLAAADGQGRTCASVRVALVGVDGSTVKVLVEPGAHAGPPGRHRRQPHPGLACGALGRRACGALGTAARV